MSSKAHVATAAHPAKRVKSAPASASHVSHVAPTVADILSDSLTKTANSYWAPGNPKLKPFSAALIEKIYREELQPVDGKLNVTRVVLLEFSCYLEKFAIF